MTDPSQPLANARHEAFALAWAGEKVSAAAAYRLAGYGAKDANAKGSRMASNGIIIARKEWLQRQTATKNTLTQSEKREILAGIARSALPLERIAAIKADNDISGDSGKESITITITKAWN